MELCLDGGSLQRESPPLANTDRSCLSMDKPRIHEWVSIKSAMSRCVHALCMYLLFPNQTSVAFGNEDCQRSSYGIYESLYEMGVYPHLPPWAQSSSPVHGFFPVASLQYIDFRVKMSLKAFVEKRIRLILRELFRMALGFWEPWVSIIRSRVTQKIKARIYGFVVSASLIFLYWNFFVGKSSLRGKTVLRTFLQPSSFCKELKMPYRNSCTREDAISASFEPIVNLAYRSIPVILTLCALQCGYLVYSKVAKEN